MPIIDIQFVLPKGQALPEGLAQDLVDRLGRVLSVQPGHLWLRLQVLPASLQSVVDTIQNGNVALTKLRSRGDYPRMRPDMPVKRIRYGAPPCPCAALHYREARI